MAFESRYWRTQLKRDISFIAKKIDISVVDMKPDDLDTIFSQIEIKLFTITYSLRKLMDTRKFPDTIAEKNVQVVSYRRNEKPIKPFGMFADYYELDSGTELVKKSLREICNQFTHAYFFNPVPNSEGRIKDIFFVSDRDREKCLYSFKMS